MKRAAITALALSCSIGLMAAMPDTKPKKIRYFEVQAFGANGDMILNETTASEVTFPDSNILRFYNRDGLLRVCRAATFRVLEQQVDKAEVPL